MVKMKLKVENDSNKLKYISILRGNSNRSIGEMKKNIESNNFVLECDYFNTEGLKKLKAVIDKLIDEKAKVYLFQDDREVPKDYVKNLIGTYEQIAQEREELDNETLDDD